MSILIKSTVFSSLNKIYRVAGYSKFAGSFPKQGKLQRKDIISDVDDLDEFEDEYNLEDAQFLQKTFREIQREGDIKTFKTIERKFFKAPTEVNLLTWDAKEQIRYLHQEFPEEWTIDRLAESFPISKEGVKRLLQSKFTLKTLHDVVKHDKKVQQEWKKLNDGNNKKGPIVVRHEHLLGDRKWETLKFAAGNKALPAPKQSLLVDGFTQKQPKPQIDGPFTRMVKDYVEKKQIEAGKELLSEAAAKQNTKLLQDNTASVSAEENRTENAKLLSSIIGSDSEQKAKKDSFELNYKHMFKYRDRNMEIDDENPNQAQFNWNGKHTVKHRDKNVQRGRSMKHCLLDSMEDDAPLDYKYKNAPNYKNRSHKPDWQSETMPHEAKYMPHQVEYMPHVIGEDSKYSQKDIDYESVAIKESGLPERRPLGRARGSRRTRIKEVQDYALKGTGKITNEYALSDTDKIAQLQSENAAAVTGPSRKYADDEDTEKLWDQVEYDYPAKLGEKAQRPEAYIYTEEHGYEHPLGRVDYSVADIDVSEESAAKDYEQEKKLHVYKKGKEHYDEDGEFLFRTP